MNRYSSYGQGDSQWQPDGDPGFKGIDMFHDRSLLQPGYLARSENKRLHHGPATTRPGTTSPGDFNAPFTNTIIGSGIYSNPNGDEVMLVATRDANYVWQLQYNKDPKTILLDPVTTQNTGTGVVSFVQAFDKVILLRIPPIGPPLIWDGNVTHHFDPITLSTDGLQLIPTTWFGEPFENRVLFYSPYNTTSPWRTQFIMSDILDYSSYDNIFGVFKVAAAAADHIVRLVGYQKGALIAVMRHSVHMLENFTVDPTQTTHRVLSNTVGGVGFKMPLLVGRELFFLSEPGGIYKVTQIVQDEIATEPIPISRPIQPVIDRINWSQAHFYGCSAALSDYAYFAVPLDQNNGANNAILVYNTSSQEWESAPDWWMDGNFRIDALHVTLYGGNRKLFGLDYAAKKIYVLYDGVSDNLNGNYLPVSDVMESRGYVCGDYAGIKKFERVQIGISGADPNATVTALTDGVNETYELATITKDRLKFYLHGHAAFDPVAGDPTEPKRMDYTVPNAEQSVLEDFEDLPLGAITVIPGTAFDYADVIKQQSLERYEVRQTGRWVSVRIENNQGQCDVLGIAVEGIPVSETIKTAA